MRCSIYHANRKHCAFGHGLIEGACTRSGRLRIAARHAQGGDVMLGEGRHARGGDVHRIALKGVSEEGGERSICAFAPEHD